MIKRPAVVLYLSLVLMCAFSAFAAPSAPSSRQPSEEEKTALKIAVEKGDVAAIRTLLDKGIAVDAPLTGDGDSALLLAVTAGKIDAVKLLLDRGADPSRRNNKWTVPIAVAAGQNQPRILDLLLSRGAWPYASIASPPELQKRSPKYSILADAAYRGNEEVFDLLLRYGPVINQPGLDRNRVANISALEAALLAGSTSFVERLIRNGALVGPELLDVARKKQAGSDVLDMLESNCPWSTEKFKARDKKIRPLYDEANKALNEGRLEEARRISEQGRAIVANNAPGFIRLIGETYLREGDDSRAYHYFARFLEINPPADKAVEVRKKLVAMERGKKALVSDLPPPWVVRYQCSGEDMDECRKQCEGGHPGSCFVLAKLLYRKTGAEGGAEKVIKYLKTACEGGMGGACKSLGDIYHEGGLGVDKNQEDALANYMFGCQLQDREGCDMQAQLFLAGVYSATKYGYNRYTAKSAIAYAVDLYRMMCDLEDPKACLMVGYMSYQSVGMPMDIPKALQALELSCGKGMARACALLAKIYTEDSGVPPDPAKAADYKAKACAAGECCKDCK